MPAAGDIGNRSYCPVCCCTLYIILVLEAVEDMTLLQVDLSVAELNRNAPKEAGYTHDAMELDSRKGLGSTNEVS